MASTEDFLVEIGTEELPPKALAGLEQAFAAAIEDGLRQAQLGFSGLQSYATPRRLAVLVGSLFADQPAQRIERRGPPVSVAFAADGSPTRAAIAFAEGCGVPVDALGRVETAKGAWLFHADDVPGRPAGELLPAIVEAALASLPIPRRMRWGNGDTEFVRPVHWVVMLLGERVLPSPILGHVPDRKTRGHRFHAPDWLAIDRPANYANLLATKGRVIADRGTRRERVSALAQVAAEAAGGAPVHDAALLDEVTALLEWPVAVTGSFDTEFLRLPDEVVVATLQGHQRYFPVRDAGGKLLPRFVTMANIESLDPDQVRQGNERVVLPRLADAAFFWDQDRRETLAGRIGRLDQVVYQKGLGSLRDRSQRVAQLAATIARQLGVDVATVERAALLAKTDLLTAMVGEFPELQGKMGSRYAIHDGESAAVAAAIEEQYLPRHAGDRLPVTPAGRVLAIADRADSLSGGFALGKRPTGNKDPFALRRAALGLLRILIEDQVDLDLTALLAEAVSLQPPAVKDVTALADELHEFILDRARSWYVEGLAPGLPAEGIAPETFEAVRLRRPVSPADFHQRLLGVQAFRELPEAASLAAANKRIANILRNSEAAGTHGAVDPALFGAPEEQALHQAIESLEGSHRQALQRHDYHRVLQGMAQLKAPVDAFFDSVLVMADDPVIRRNRLAQLHRLRALFLDVADLSCLTVPGDATSTSSGPGS